MQITYPLRLLVCLSLFLFAAISGGCGGGSKGTGGLDFEGRVVALDGSALAGALVTIVASGDSETTDQDGNFAVSTFGVFGDVEIMVDTASFSGVAVIPGVPENARLVTLYLEVDEDKGSLSARDVNIDQDDSSDDSDNDGESERDRRDGSGQGGNSLDEDGSGSDDREDSGDDAPVATPSPIPSPNVTEVPDDHGDQNDTPDGSGDGIEHPGDDGDSSEGGGGDGEEQPGNGEDAEGEGRITALGASAFTVDGIEFEYDENTRFYDQDEHLADASILALGIRVHAKGERRSGHAVATRVEVKS